MGDYSWSNVKANSTTAMGCNCIGPQNGEPKCPCMMRGLIQRDGRWIEPEKDLGPIRNVSPKEPT